MGIPNLWGRLGHDANYKSQLGKQHIPMRDKRVGYELAGRGFQAVMKAARDTGRAKDIAEHCNSKTPWADPGIAVLMADIIVKDIVCVGSAVLHLFVVPECSFIMKRHCSKRRSQKGRTAIEQKKYSKGIALPDCVVKLVASEVAKLANATFVDTVIGEGEAQLMYMLKTGVVDYMLNYSGDVDTAIYLTDAGTIVNCPQTMGSVGGRKYNGVAGVSVWGKPVVCSELFKKLVNASAADDDAVDASDWDMTERALLGGIVGHDYDSNGTDSKGQGLSKIGHGKAIKAIAASVLEKRDMVPIERVRDVCNRLKRKDKTDHNRMMAVVCGFLYHRVVDVGTGHAKTYSTPTPSCMAWMKSKEPGFYKLIQQCNKQKKVKSNWGSHRGCTGCNVHSQSLTNAIAQKVKVMLDPIRTELKPMAGENLPTLDYEILKAWIASSTKSDSLKVLREGMNRSYENARNEGTGRSHIDGSTDPPVAYLTRTEI